MLFFIVFSIVVYIIPAIVCFKDVERNKNRYRIDGDTLFFIFCPVVNLFFGYCLLLKPLDKVFDRIAKWLFS